ncbi:hypothetical protein AX15_000528 [Amanita polypyramis BW_CC]|nr:hypothetical protein AX15_000528 [Amanita polypyramis BW_CC]
MGKRKHGGLTGLSGFVAKAFIKEVDRATEGTKFPDAPPAPGTKMVQGGSTSLLATPSKKRKLDNGDDRGEPDTQQQPQHQHWIKKYDATGLVPHYSDASQVPQHLQKYFHQRESYLSLYSTPPGCLLDEEGWYSITPEAIASHIAERCRCDVIIDAFCGVGGNAIAFAKTCQRVIAIDNNPTRLALARHNAQIYGVTEHIEFVLADFISFAGSYIAPASTSKSNNAARKIDAIFLSPPWGGPSYLSGTSSPTKGNNGENNDSNSEAHGFPPYSLTSIEPIQGAELFHLARKITKNIAYYLPRNTRMEEVSELLRNPVGQQAQEEQEMVEVEEAWTGSKLKAVTCYFGGLASGQETMF